LKKLWGGRFKKEISKEVFEFTKSISFDSVLLPYDVKGSVAHIQMLCKVGIITKKECSILLRAFGQILNDFNSGNLKITEDFEDIHSYVQFLMQEKVGNLAKKIHTARSRNDQVSLDVRLYCRDVLYRIIDLIEQVQKTVAKLGLDNKDIIIPGFTHLQHAQPVLLAHHLHSYIEMLERDSLRFKNTLERVNVLPLGSGAIAGTSLGIDREFVAKKLGFNSVSKNSMDAVSDRDFIIEILSNCAITGMHLSRFCEDIILWNTQEFGWVVLNDSISTGSSMMPNKKNPDVFELIRGKTGRLYGNLINILTVMKSLPSTYNRDMQEDKEPLFDSIGTIEGSLNVLNVVLSSIGFDRGKIAKSLSDEELYATDIAEYLVKKGIAFRDAHEIVGKLISYAKQKKVKISELKPEELKKIHPKIDRDVINLLNCEVSVDSKTSYEGTNRQMVIKNLEEV
jgi:argininosuccinate lyase